MSRPTFLLSSADTKPMLDRGMPHIVMNMCWHSLDASLGAPSFAIAPPIRSLLGMAIAGGHEAEARARGETAG